MSRVHLLGTRQGAYGDGSMPKKPMEIVNPILIIGPAEHGKSTVRRMLGELTELKTASCSDVIYTIWSYLSGKGEQELRDIPKGQSRPTLVLLGDWLTGGNPNEYGVRTNPVSFRQNFPYAKLPYDPTLLDNGRFPLPNPSFLIQFLWLNGFRIIDGIRRSDELLSAYPPLEWTGAKPVIIWVEDPRKPRIEGDNFNIPKEWADLEIVNDGSLEELKEKCVRAVEFYHHKKNCE